MYQGNKEITSLFSLVWRSHTVVVERASIYCTNIHLQSKHQGQQPAGFAHSLLGSLYTKEDGRNLRNVVPELA